MHRESKELSEFQVACQNFYTCFYFASIGLTQKGSELNNSGNPEAEIIIGTGHPDEGNWHSRLEITHVKEASKKDGVYSDTLAKSFIAYIYAEWDEYYRHKIAQSIGVKKTNIKSDLMGDLRLIRNCIVHNNSVITNEHQKIKELNWDLKPGKLSITLKDFSTLLNQINRMVILAIED